MSKFVEKMRRSPRNIRFDELDRFLRNEGFMALPQPASHGTYRREDGVLVTVVRPHGGGKTSTLLRFGRY